MARPELEAAIRERFDRGDLRGAATLAVKEYGGEITGYLAAVLRDEEQAREVFADTLVELWKDLPGFRWEASLRTWLYTLARHRLSAFLAKPARRREVGLSGVQEVDELAAMARTTTVPWQRTEVKDEVAQLRESLSVDDQTLLILRIDRGMSWNEVARVLGEGSPPALRKRYERIKEKLRALTVR
jgi:RNA polymerase sigma-70 factor (ECF subfamily)